MSVTKKAGLTVMEKVFIGCSGEISTKVAVLLRRWLEGMFDNRFILYTPDSFALSWRDSLDEVMSAADCGLLCVTEDNVDSTWLAYEAGVLKGNAKPLILLLFEVTPSQLSEPLRRFRSLQFNLGGMWELTAQLIQLCGDNRLSAQELNRRFQARYPTLEAVVNEKLSEIKSQVPSASYDRKYTVISDEILSQLAELKKAVEELKTKTSPASSPRVSP